MLQLALALYHTIHPTEYFQKHVLNALIMQLQDCTDSIIARAVEECEMANSVMGYC